MLFRSVSQSRYGVNVIVGVIVGVGVALLVKQKQDSLSFLYQSDVFILSDCIVYCDPDITP